MKSRKVVVIWGALMLLLGTTSGCSSLTNSLGKLAGEYVPFYDFDGTLITSITIKSDPDSNGNLPVAVDILFIVDSNVAATLSNFSGPDWFAQKQAMLMKYQQTMVLSHLEVVPQSAELQVVLPDEYYQAVSVLLFANYVASQGQYVADITKFKQLRITLKNRGYVLEELNP